MQAHAYERRRFTLRVIGAESTHTPSPMREHQAPLVMLARRGLVHAPDAINVLIQYLGTNLEIWLEIWLEVDETPGAPPGERSRGR